MFNRILSIVVGVVLIVVVGACQNGTDIINSTENTGNDPQAESVLLRPVVNPPTPGPLTTVTFGDQSLTLWPFTSNDFSGTPQDPINLIFVGKADPRRIRAALMSLDGDRTALGFPPVAPFNSQWTDAIGDVQSGYGNDEWTGGVIQLACGDYGPIRFHIRLFTMGDWTVGNAHFEALIPGTADHQVLNWEIAEQFVIADFMRSGLLDASAPMLPTGQINPSPFRTIPAIIYNGLPEELKAMIGGPGGSVTEDVPIGTDGYAMILNIAGEVPIVPGTRSERFTITYGQAVPKPFCNDGDDYVYVAGPVELEQIVTITPELRYEFSFRAQGTLSVTPINPMTGEPLGMPLQANVNERHWGVFDSRAFTVTSRKWQRMVPADAPGAGSMSTGIVIRSDQHNSFAFDVDCAPVSIVAE